MEHQYIVTNDIPELAALGREIPPAVDFDGAAYLRQERHGLVLGTYEQDCRHWAVNGCSRFHMTLRAYACADESPVFVSACRYG